MCSFYLFLIKIMTKLLFIILAHMFLFYVSILTV